MQKISYLIIAVSFLTFSCEDELSSTQMPEILKERTWVHNHEEDREDLAIYKPADVVTLPLSWYRQTYLFYSDKACDYLVLAPNDAHYIETGYWTYEEGVIRVFNAQDELQHSLEVVNWSNTALVLKK